MGTGSKHEFTLSVGVVDLPREEGGQLIRPAYGLVQKALPVAGAVLNQNTSQVNEAQIRRVDMSMGGDGVKRNKACTTSDWTEKDLQYLLLGVIFCAEGKQESLDS